MLSDRAGKSPYRFRRVRSLVVGMDSYLTEVMSIGAGKKARGRFVQRLTGRVQNFVHNRRRYRELPRTRGLSLQRILFLSVLALCASAVTRTAGPLLSQNWVDAQTGQRPLMPQAPTRQGFVRHLVGFPLVVVIGLADAQTAGRNARRGFPARWGKHGRFSCKHGVAHGFRPFPMACA